MRVFVTGGTGLLGNAVLRELNAAGHDSVALVRSPCDSVVFEGIDTEIVSGDLLDRDLITNVIQNCDAVIHAAGLIHLGWKRLQESMKVNGEGTQIMVDACLQHGCKLIHVGTVNTLAVGTREQPADESTPRGNAGGQIPCSYVVSKRAGVEAVKRGVEQGLQAVILAPGFMLGPWDWKPSSGRMMLALSKGWKLLAPSGGCSVCDVRDVAAATITSVNKDLSSGREFILAGENLTYEQLWKSMAERFGQRPPLMRAGPLQRRMAAALGDVIGRIHKEPDFNSAAVEMSSQYHWYDSSRAEHELGYKSRHVQQTLDDAAAWLREKHM
ncbi:NAD-dependent epimerase/dehydratase family protein [Rubripirellula sp.]|jgi:dihydroflavonol-4-reductase|nr:NAD-dependent epimerase/dehydratase family protein [Rubripirellula sp.]